MSERNADLFQEVAAHIERYPERYDQSVYARETTCGTAFCIAGWASECDAKRQGYRILPQYEGYRILPQYESVLVENTPLECHATDRSTVGVTMNMHSYAQRALGLNEQEADYLFGPGWRPRPDLTVAEALVKIGNGESVRSVTDPDYDAATLRCAPGAERFL